MPILTHGGDDLRRRYLPGLIDGSLLGRHGMSEPDSGSDAFSLRTTAEKRGEDYVLNGTKTFVTNGPSADIFLVFATVDPSAGFMGLSAFVVERSTPGIEVTKVSKLGLRTAEMGRCSLMTAWYQASRGWPRRCGVFNFQCFAGMGAGGNSWLQRWQHGIPIGALFRFRS